MTGPRRGAARDTSPGQTLTSSTTSETESTTAGIPLQAQLERVHQKWRRQMALQEASEAAEWLRMVLAGETPIDVGLAEAHRSVNMAIGEIMRNGELS